MALVSSHRTSSRAAGLSLAGPIAALCLGAAAMGVSPVFVRGVAGEVGPFASAFWRVALALPLLYVWMRVEEAGQDGPRPGLDRATLAAGLVFAGDLFFWHLAILHTTVANATFFATTAPVFVVLVAWLALGQRPARATLVGLALCLAGGAALIGQTVRVAPERMTGDLFGVATAVFFGLYFLAVGRARRSAGAARVTFLLSLVTAALLLGVALVAEPARILPTSPRVWELLVGMAWISHAGGQGLLSIALGRLPPVFSSLVIFLEAVVAALAGVALLDEPLSLVQAGGGALILVGIWTARPRRARQEEAA